MKKATLMVCYVRGRDGIIVKSVHALYRGGRASLNLSRANYQSILAACGNVLSLAKNNNFRVSYYECFGARWYDILWIDCDTGAVYKYSTR